MDNQFPADADNPESGCFIGVPSPPDYPRSSHQFLLCSIPRSVGPLDLDNIFPILDASQTLSSISNPDVWRDTSKNFPIS